MTAIKAWGVDFAVGMSAIGATVGVYFAIDSWPAYSWIFSVFTSLFVCYFAIQIVVALVIRRPVPAVLFGNDRATLGGFIGTRIFMMGIFVLGHIGANFASCCVRLPWQI